jgi:ribosomal protein S9
MATNLHIDAELLAQAVKLGGNKTKRETVNEALAEFVRKRKAKDLIALFGTIDYDPDYDYKEQRKFGTRKARRKTQSEP